MNRPTFFEGTGVALIAALSGSLSFAVLAWALPGTLALRLVTAGLGLGYLLYLLARSGERVGRVTTLVAWLLAAAILWALAPPLPLYVLAHLGLVWLVRSLYFHQGLLAALADLGLTGLGLIAGVGAYLHTGSLFLAVWSLSLVQALFVFIPTRRPGNGRDIGGENDSFERAHRTAEAALGRLSTIR
ncbi:MAG: hypothetical protein U9Q81_20120 [Pseudomonadota bacterium]|nr:hypothetical protein [Pseudomonadota bacterium]